MTAPRKATNLSLDADLLRDARALDINLSRAAEAGLTEAVRAARAARWKAQNAAALEAANAHVAEHGLPLERYRLF